MLNYPKKPFFAQKGQTLVELVVAISIILIGVVSALVLTMVTIRGGKESGMQVTAANLAREGVEVVRQKRDSNWLKIESNTLSFSQWDDGLKNEGNDYTTIALFVESSHGWTLDYNAGTSIEECADNDSCRLYFQNGIYSHDPGGEASPYYRLIQTNEVCLGLVEGQWTEQIVSSGNNCGLLGESWEKIGIQVLSEVRWRVKNSWQSLVFEDHLYNWK